MKDQIKDTWPGCWMEHAKVICEKCEASQQKTKLRFIKEYSRKQYISELNFKRCKMMVKIRLNLIETKCNYKGICKDNLKCEICKLENYTTLTKMYKQ